MELIRPQQAAQILGVHSNTLRNWVTMGILTERRTPTNHRRFDRVEVESLLKENTKSEKE